MPSQTDNLMLDDDSSGLPRTINVASDDIVLSVDLTLQSGGILTADNIKRGTADPNVAAVSGNEGDVYQRTLAASGELYVNTDGTATGWALMSAGVTLQSAYVGGNTITTSGGEGNVTITGTEDLVFTGSDFLIDPTSSFSIDGVASSNVTVTGAQLQISTVTSGELDLTSAGLMDVNAGANLDIDVTGTFDVLSTSTFSIDGTGASNVSATSGDLTLSTITSGNVVVAAADAVTITAGNEGAATGNLVSLTAGSGGGNNPGGAVSLLGGTGGNGGTSGVGGALTFTAGTGGTTGAGGAVTISGGAGGASGNGGALTVQGGTATDGNGGAATLAGRAGVGTSRNGGAATVSGGAATGSGTGGNLSLSAGSTVSGTAGTVSIVGGSGGTSGTSGFVQLVGGTGNATGAGATSQVLGGSGGSTSGAGGLARLRGGTPTDGNGGAVEVTGQNAATTTATNRNGGAISVTGGNPTLAGVGGSVSVTAGTGGATGTAGAVTLTGGAGGSTSGAAGAVTVQGGTPTDGNGGSVTLTASAGVGTNRSGGTWSGTAGNATGSGTGGSTSLTAGSGGATGTAGTLTLTSGAGGSSSGNAGNIVLTSGSVTSGALGVVRISNTALEIIEAASVPGPTIAATQGRFWVRNDAPNVPMFTDDTGTDWNLLASSGGGSVDWKDSVRAATVSTVALSGEQTIDGVSLVSGDRVLVKNQDATISSGSLVGTGELTTDSATFVDALCTSPVLAAGDWLAIGLANFKNETADYYAAQMEARFGTTRYAYSAFRSMFGSFSPGNDAAGAPFMLFARVTSTGSETLNMRAAALGNTPGDDILVGSQQWLYFNLDSLTLNADYWVAEGPNTDSAAVTPSGTTWTGDEELIFTPTESGEYLILAYAEGFNAGVADTNEYHARLRMNGVTIGTETEFATYTVGATDYFCPSFCVIDVRTLTASTPYTIGWEFRNAAGNSSFSYRRQRLYAFRLAVFANSATVAIYDGMQPNNSTVECTTTLGFNFGTAMTTFVLGTLTSQNGGAFGQGWLRQDGSPDTDYPPDGRMWAYPFGGLTSTSEMMPMTFAARATVSGGQVWRHVGDSDGAATLTYGRDAGNTTNSRMPMVAFTMQTAASASANGIYVVDTGAWSRSSDADTDAEVTSMLTVAVDEGVVNANTYWYLSTSDPITVGSTALTFQQLGNPSGSGLTQAQVLARISLGV